MKLVNIKRYLIVMTKIIGEAVLEMKVHKELKGMELMVALIQ